MTDIAHISPRSSAIAEALLAAAADLGYDARVVQVRRNGYSVPADVAQRLRAMEAGETEPEAVVDAPAAEAQDEPEDGPDESWKNADIEAYAAERDIDLGGATKKADMLAAIAAAQKES